MPKTKNKKEILAEQIASITGQSIEDVLKEMPDTPDKLATEEELMHQAQAVVSYYEKNGNGFYKEKCSECERFFAYSYHYKGITKCSIECMARSLRRIGLEWHYNRPLDLRWGRIAPAVIPPEALEILESVSSEQCISVEENTDEDFDELDLLLKSSSELLDL